MSRHRNISQLTQSHPAIRKSTYEPLYYRSCKVYIHLNDVLETGLWPTTSLIQVLVLKNDSTYTIYKRLA